MIRALAAATLAASCLFLAAPAVPGLPTGAAALAKKPKKPAKATKPPRRKYRVSAEGSYDYTETWSNAFPGAADPPPGPATKRDNELIDWIAFGRVTLEKRGKGFRGLQSVAGGALSGNVTGYRRDTDTFGWAKDYTRNEWIPCPTADRRSMPRSVPLRGSVSTGAGTTALSIRFERASGEIARGFAAPCGRTISGTEPFAFRPVHFGQELPAVVRKRCTTEGGWGDDSIEQTCSYTLDTDVDGGAEGGRGHSRFTWTVSVTLTAI